MPVTVGHILTATTPDDPGYEIRPSHWNSNHAVTLNISGTDIFGAFANDGNVTFGTNVGGFVTATANVTAAPSPVNVTGANGSSVNAQTIAFSNANGISLGVSTAANGATITGSYTVPTQSVQPVAFSAVGGSSNFSTLSFSNANGISFSNNAGQVQASYTVPTVTNSSMTVSDAGTSGTLARLAFTNLNGVTLSLSTGAAGSHTIVGSHNGLTSQSNQAASASNGSFAFQTLGFSNANNVTFGTSAGSIISASVLAQTNQSLGIYASSQTFGQSSSSTYDARSLSVVGSGGVSVGWSNSSLLISGTTYPAQSVQSAIKAFGASNTGNTAGNTGVSTGIDWVLAGSNNVTISQSTAAGGPNTLWISGPTVGGAQTGISGIQVSNTTYTSGTVTFQNANGISFGSSGANGISASYTVPTQTNQSLGIYGSSQTYGQSSSSTYDARSLSIVGSGGVSVGWSNSSLLISGQTTAAQTNQSLGIYASSNTTGQSSSSTHDARSLTMVGSDNISIGWSNGSLIFKGAAGGGVTPVASASNGSFSFTTLAFSNANNVTFGTSAGSIITASVAAPGAAAENNWVNLLGANTAGNTTVSGSTLGFSGINMTLSGTNNSQMVLSVPATSSLVGVNGISISTNGSTISISNQQYTASFFEPEIYGGTTTATNANGTVYVRPFYLGGYVNANQLRLLQQITSQVATTFRISGSVSAGNASSGTASFGLSGTALLFSRVSTGTAANSSQIISFKSQTYSWGAGLSNSVSWSTNASSATVSWTTSQAISFISSINSTGGFTTGSFGTSGSSTFSSTSTNANSISSTYVGSFASQNFSQVRPLIIPLGTTLSPGEYWLGHIQSTATGSTNYSHQSILMPSSAGLVYYTTNTSGYAEIGSSATIASSNLKWGAGSYSASSQTTTTIPISQISAQSNYSLYFNFVGQVK